MLILAAGTEVPSGARRLGHVRGRKGRPGGHDLLRPQAGQARPGGGQRQDAPDGDLQVLLDRRASGQHDEASLRAIRGKPLETIAPYDLPVRSMCADSKN